MAARRFKHLHGGLIALLAAYAAIVTIVLVLRDGPKGGGKGAALVAPPETPIVSLPDDSSASAPADSGRAPAATTSDPVDGPVPMALTVLVVEEHYRPIPGAAVFVKLHGVARMVGVSDELGLVPVQREGPGDGSLHATHRDFAPGTVGFREAELRPGPAGEPPRLTIVLKSPAKLIGVASIQGQRAPAGIQVRAIPAPAASRIHVQDPARFLADPEHISASTDETGTFALLVEPERAYVLCAGGKGIVQARVTAALRASDSPVVLEMAYGYVVTIGFSSQGILLGSLGRGVHGGFELTLAEDDPSFGPSDFPLMSAVLAGAPKPFVLRSTENLSVGRLIQRYTSSQPRENLGPIRVMGHFPGYEPITTKEWARPVDERLIWSGVPLKSSEAGHGSLVVRTRGGGPSEELLSVALPPHALLLTDSEGRTARFVLGNWTDGACTVSAVPAGSHAWEAHSAPSSAGKGTRGGHAGRVDVRAGETSEVVWDWSGGGGVELAVSNPDGSPYCGTLRVRFAGTTPADPARAAEASTDVPGDDGSIVFIGPPYRIVNLDPRDYWLVVGESATAEPTPLTISAGAMESLQVTLAER